MKNRLWIFVCAAVVLLAAAVFVVTREYRPQHTPNEARARLRQPVNSEVSTLPNPLANPRNASSAARIPAEPVSPEEPPLLGPFEEVTWSPTEDHHLRFKRLIIEPLVWECYIDQLDASPDFSAMLHFDVTSRATPRGTVIQTCELAPGFTDKEREAGIQRMGKEMYDLASKLYGAEPPYLGDPDHPFADCVCASLVGQVYPEIPPWKDEEQTSRFNWGFSRPLLDRYLDTRDEKPIPGIRD